jgi:hypothetical protein
MSDQQETPDEGSDQSAPETAIDQVGTEPVGESEGIVTIGTEPTALSERPGPEGIYVVGTEPVGKSQDPPGTQRSASESDED